MFLTKLKHIKAFVLDIDGVLTDSTILVTETGEQLRRFNVRDGYALQLAIKKGFLVAVISGGKSQTVVNRLKGLGISDIHLGVSKKIVVYNEFMTKYQLSKEDVLFMGDDIPDLPLMKAAGVATCPADATEEIKFVSDYISNKNGGAGCVRDIIEKVLKVRELWFDAEHSGVEEIIPSA